MIGQKKLLQKLNNYTIDNFPRSILLLGEEGSGKNTVAKYIADNILKLPLFNISDTISDTLINEIYRSANPAVYVIDLRKFNTTILQGAVLNKESNILLKFIEEPLENAFVILLANDKVNVMETVYNRCVVFEMNFYTTEELAQIQPTNNTFVYDIIKTPGKLLKTNLDTINDLYNLCVTIAEKLNIANYDNSLSIVDKLNLKGDEYSKYDPELFINCLGKVFRDAYINNHDINCLKMYKLLLNKKQCLVDNRIKKEYFFLNLITSLWLEVR